MRRAFSLLEFIIAFSILSLIFILSGRFNPEPPLILAAQSLLNDIALTQNLALRDSRFFPNLTSTSLTQSLSPSIDPSKLLHPAPKSMWQIQFHLSGIYTQNSYSIYIDTPRYSPTTDFDGRPMSGDFIAIEPFNNQCLSGYNNTNVSDYCKNNTSALVRLKEYFGVENILLGGGILFVEKKIQPESILMILACLIVAKPHANLQSLLKSRFLEKSNPLAFASHPSPDMFHFVME